MLRIANIGSYMCTTVRSTTNVNFCIEDINDDDITAYISIFSHDCKADHCNCKETECCGKIFNTDFVIPMHSFQSVSDDAIAYATEHLDNVNNREQNNDELVFDLMEFMESLRLLNLPELTTGMLAELPPKLLVYNYIVNYVDECKYTDITYVDDRKYTDINYVDERKYTDSVLNNITYNTDNGTREMTYDAVGCLSAIKHNYSWILVDEEFDETNLHMLKESFNISLVQMIQDVENAYNELYGTLVNHENPNGLFK